MTYRERVLSTFRFEPTDRPACDLMESAIWPELMDYFRSIRGLPDEDKVRDYLDTDFRWTGYDYLGPEGNWVPVVGLTNEQYGSYADCIYERPLARAKTVADVEANKWPDPDHWEPVDLKAKRQQWPE